MSKIHDPLLDKEQQVYEGGGETLGGGWDLKKLNSISNLDNQHGDGDGPRPSSEIIIKEFGGIEGLIKGLESDETTGIPADSVQRRQRIYGTNAFPPPEIKTLMELILENFNDPINVILCGAAVVSIIIGLIREGFPEGLTEGLSIMIALVIIFVVNSGNNYMSERQLAKMVMQCDKKKIAVWRGKAQPDMIDNDDLVVGDVFKFENGMKLPADAVVIEAQDVKCTEADLTGEPDEFVKIRLDEENYQFGENSGVLLAKSLCVNGRGRAVVTSVGINTSAGAISNNSDPREDTDLQKKLEVIAGKIGQVGILAAILTFASMILRSILEMSNVLPCGCGNIMSCQPENGCVPLSFQFTKENRFWMNVLEGLIISISVIVCAIPEGLPLAVTISLSFSSSQMKKLNNLVRNLNSSETMGSATHICSDKTGTLTQNKMTVMAVMIGSSVWHVKDQTLLKELIKGVTEFASNTTLADLGLTIKEFMFNSVMWNSSAFFTQITAEMVKEQEQFKNRKVGEWVTQGNVTEQAILNYYMNMEGGEACVDHKATLKNIQEDIIEFTSARKKASVIVKTDVGYVMYTKGGPDFLGKAVTKIVGSDGQVYGIDDTVPASEELGSDLTGQQVIDNTVEIFAKQALRTILMAYRVFSEDEYQAIKAENNDFQTEADREVLEQDLTAVGIWGIQDPLRDGIKEAIIKCKEAGIQVIMCTGDNLDTAIAISKNAGIVTEEQAESEEREYTCTTGKDFREKVGEDLIEEKDKDGKVISISVKNKKEFGKYFKNLRVLARAQPLDKKILVTGIQQYQGVVAVTGDGSNDAPALKKADVGFSMGITGTDIAKAASDIILLDDNFTSIVVALKFGRNVYDSVRKFLQFQLSVNITAMAIVFFGSCILSDSPLNAVQMLWVNLVMDTFGALALATEAPNDSILKRQPYKKSDPIVNQIMWRNIFGHAIFQIIVLAGCIFWVPGHMIFDYWQACTKQVDDISKCDSWNPFYANDLYFTSETKATWAKRTQNEGFNWDQELLKQYNCFLHSEKNPDFDFADCDAFFKKQQAAGVITPETVELFEPTQKMLHYTIIFQVFVFMQIFNLINSRKINEELNVFAGFFNNVWFIVIFILTIIIQCVLVELGGNAVKTFPLNLQQNLICLGIGALELVWGLILKFLPLKWFQCISLDVEEEKEDDEFQPKKSAALALKRTSTQKSKPKSLNKSGKS